MTSSQKIKKELKKLSNPNQAKILQRFFKTGKGEYAEGQKFLGVKTADQRKLAKKYQDLSLKELQGLFKDNNNTYRFVALCILIIQFEHRNASESDKKKIFNFYIKNSKEINNWDLVDISAPHILGKYLIDKPKDVLYKFANSKNLWQKRISILSTFAFIREGDFKDTLRISEILLNDEHDLIHKAVGWMLREVGNRSQQAEEKFLKKHYKKMPRTMLRYAIEKFPEKKRKAYLKGLI